MQSLSSPSASSLASYWSMNGLRSFKVESTSWSGVVGLAATRRAAAERASVRSEERPALVHQSSLRVLTRLARCNRGGAMPDPLQDAGTVSRPPE